MDGDFKFPKPPQFQRWPLSVPRHGRVSDQTGRAAACKEKMAHVIAFLARRSTL